MDLYNELLNLPKVELHRHLEGSLRPETIFEIVKEYRLNVHFDSVESLREQALVLKPMNNLREVLDRFDIARSCFINKETTELISYRTCLDAFAENTKLLELRFSPGFIAQPFGHSYEMIFESVLSGVNKAERETGITVGLIIICSRDLGVEEAEKTLDFAVSCKDKIVGVDLAGDEAWSPEMFIPAFAKVRKHGIKITAHSGEAINPHDILTCINSLGAQRIGHGIRMIHSPEIMEEVKEKGITFELCPTSNYLTRSTDKTENHPAKIFFDKGINVTVHSDDPGLFDINLTSEYQLCVEKLGFTVDEIKQTIQNSLDASFVDDAVKAEIRQKYFNN